MVASGLNEKDGVAISNKLEMKDNNFLSNYLLSHSLLYGKKTKFKVFINILLNIIK